MHCKFIRSDLSCILSNFFYFQLFSIFGCFDSNGILFERILFDLNVTFNYPFRLSWLDWCFPSCQDLAADQKLSYSGTLIFSNEATL